MERGVYPGRPLQTTFQDNRHRAFLTKWPVKGCPNIYTAPNQTQELSAEQRTPELLWEKMGVRSRPLHPLFKESPLTSTV